MSDTIAIGALRELTEHGIHAPDDVRLMGFDGIPFSACTNPSALWRWTSPQWLVRLSIAW
ncbi:substrate-binding domain-containing protein [Bifidobacterium longum]|uniref:substrate-binding domain-containing protein n=1 Tax=Bifidobacterium longum TaxID=216816 RepID=UPI00374EA2E4